MLLAPSQILLFAFQVATAIHGASTIVAPALPEKKLGYRWVQTSHLNDFPIKNGDFPIKNGDFPIIEGCHRCASMRIYRCISICFYLLYIYLFILNEHLLPSNVGGIQLSDNWRGYPTLPVWKMMIDSWLLSLGFIILYGAGSIQGWWNVFPLLVWKLDNRCDQQQEHRLQIRVQNGPASGTAE